MTADRTFSVRGKRVTVAGAARSGVAAAELLARRGARVTLTDAPRERRRRRTGCALAGVALELGGHRRGDVHRRRPRRAQPGRAARPAACSTRRARAGVPVIGELELASRWLRGRVIAITGTKGKSTTTTLTGRMLEAAGHRVLVGGNIGTALSAQVDDSTPETLHVVEASSFQLETIDRVPPVDRGDAELLARPSRSARRRSRSTPRRRRGSSRTSPPTTGRSSTPTMPRRFDMAAGIQARALAVRRPARTCATG